jgi:hypothetical protein
MKLHTEPNIYTICVLFILSVCSCRKSTSIDETNRLMNSDRYYSSLSAEKGRNAAFLTMFDSSGVTLAAHRPPIVGFNEIKKVLLSKSDSSFTLTWEPMFAKVAVSGELGYTYGTYKLKVKGSGTVLEGTYTTFWGKNSQGKWKALMDTGNEGLK